MSQTKTPWYKKIRCAYCQTKLKKVPGTFHRAIACKKCGRIQPGRGSHRRCDEATDALIVGLVVFCAHPAGGVQMLLENADRKYYNMKRTRLVSVASGSAFPGASTRCIGIDRRPAPGGGLLASLTNWTYRPWNTAAGRRSSFDGGHFVLLVGRDERRRSGGTVG